MPEESIMPRIDAGAEAGFGIRLETVPDAAVVCDGQGAVVAWNPAAGRLFGYEPPDTAGRPLADLLQGGPDAERLSQRLAARASASEPGPPEWIEARARRKDGSGFWAEIHLAPFAVRSGDPPLAIAFVHDITKRKLKEHMATIQNAIASILSAAPDLDSALPLLLSAGCAYPPWVLGAFWSWSESHQALRCVHVHARDPGAGEAFRARSMELSVRAGEGLPGRVLASGAAEWMDDVRDREEFLRAAEASVADLHAGFAFPIHADGKVFGLFEFFTDETAPMDPEFVAMTESLAIQVSRFIGRRKSDEDLAAGLKERARSRDELAVILEGAADGIAAWSPEGRLVFCNDNYARLLGLPDAGARRDVALAEVTDFLGSRDENGKPLPRAELPVYAALRGETVRRALLLRSPATGEELSVHVHSAPVIDDEGKVKMAIIVIHDRTDQLRAEQARKAAEERMHQAQKMEAMGRLAGGIAHDFNNLLTAINGYSDLLSETLAGDPSNRGFVLEIRRAGERAAALTQQLLAYSRKQVLQKKIFRVDDVLRDMETLLRRLIGEHIALTVSTDAGDMQVEMDPGHLEQIILNLAINARDAMPGGGSLEIATSSFRAGPDNHALLPEMREGPYMHMRIRDSGTGMDQGTLEHLFEPFFTTKEQGKGTGLGLSTVYGILNQAEGQVSVDSHPGQGTVFDVYIPARRASAPGADPHPRAEDAPPARSQGTILIAEDEDLVRNFTRRILESEGFSILEAPNGAAALEASRRHPGPIHILLSDVVMPVMGGAELAEAFCRERPDAKILFVSGYTSDAAITQRLGPDTEFLPKPFTRGALLDKVRSLFGVAA